LLTAVNSPGWLDKFVSYKAFQKLNHDRLLEEARLLNGCTVKWLLITKARIDNSAYLRLTKDIRISVSSIMFWKACNSEAAQEEEYLNDLNVCDMVVGIRGKKWVCEQLKSPSGSSLDLAPPTVEYSGDKDKSLYLQRQKAINLMISSHSLQVAAYYGDRSIVETLLTNGANPDSWHEAFGFALYAAAYSGHTDIARLLIKHGGNLQVNGPLGTPLEAAAHQGHAKTMELIWERETDMDPKSRCLLYASQEGHEEAVRLLLARNDIDVKARYHIGLTPLLLAIKNNHDGVAKLLLGRHDSRYDYTEYTDLLLCALKREQTDIAQLLLEQLDVIVYDEVSLKSSFLEWTVCHGHHKVVHLLLERGGKDLNSKNCYGYTLLFLAIERGHTEVVRRLLARENVDPNIGRANDATPLEDAIIYSEEAIVKLLLERRDVDPNRGQLYLAASYNEAAIVRLLLERVDINPNLQDSTYGETPLVIATSHGYDSVVQLLLSSGHIDPNICDANKKSPLWWAVYKKHADIVQLLLKHCKTDLNLQDKEGCTPLLVAIRERYHPIMKLLLEHPNTNPNLANYAGCTPLLIAANYGYDSVVQLLLQHRETDPNLQDKEGCTPLLVATRKRYHMIIGLLLKHPNTNPNLANYAGYTPLFIAVRYGYNSVVQLLVSSSRVPLNIPDYDRQSLL
jgi:ankyrin repeat protein